MNQSANHAGPIVVERASIQVWPVLVWLLAFIFKGVLTLRFSTYVSDIPFEVLTLLVTFTLSVEYSPRVDRYKSIACIVILFLYWLDANVLGALDYRLTLDNFIAHYKYVDEALNFISFKVIILSAILIVVGFLFRKVRIATKYTHHTIYVSAFFALVFFLVVNLYSNQEVYAGDGIVKINTNPSAYDLISQTIVTASKQYPDLKKKFDMYWGALLFNNMRAHSKDKKNLIIVLSESLSAVDSKYVGGLFDRMPLTDKIQEQGLAFTNLSSNGKISVQSLGALLMGIQPTRVGGYSSLYKQYPIVKNTNRSLIKFAQKQGYHTVAILSSRTRWFNMKGWMSEAGFEKVYDKDWVMKITNNTRVKSAPLNDEDLFQAALKLIPQLKKPYVIFIETKSAHRPYLLPHRKYGGSDNFQSLIKFVDHATNDFYQGLKSHAYFNNGVMLILGDHRRFEPFSSEEVKSGGLLRWHERIVGAFVGKGIPVGVKYDQPEGQTDLYVLLHHFFMGGAIDAAAIKTYSIPGVLGIDHPMVSILADSSEGKYLIRTSGGKGLYLSIFGAVPFGSIPGLSYKKMVAYLVLNEASLNKLRKNA